jgi:signal peptidase II
MAEAAVISTTAEALRANRGLGLAVAACVFAADQAAKWLVLNPLHLVERSSTGAGIEILPFFRFVYVENPGVSMRFLPAEAPAMRWVLVAATAGIAAFVFAWMWREKRRGDAAALALVLGGALGNIADRARLGFVVDFADLHFGGFSPFLVFNVGDAAITIGVLLLLARALLGGLRPSRRTAEAANG